MKDSPNHLSALAKVRAEQREVSWTGRMESKVFIFPSLVMGENLLNEMPQNQRKCSVHPWVLDNVTKNDGSSPTDLPLDSLCSLLLSPIGLCLPQGAWGRWSR